MARYVDPNTKECFVVVRGYYSGSDSSSDDGKEDWVFNWNYDPKRFTQEYMKIAKSMKCILTGSTPDSCTIGLSLLQNCCLDNEMNISAILEHGGLDALVNLVEANHIPCRVGALATLKKITWNKDIVVQVMNLGLGPLLVDRLGDFVVETRILACDIIANIGTHRCVSRAIRKLDGIGRLILQMNVAKKALIVTDSNLTNIERFQLELTSSAANALWALSKFKKNRGVMLRTGIIPLVSKLILCGKSELTTPMTGVLSNCSSEPLFQLAIENEAIVGVLLMDLRGHYDLNLKKLCARALANAAGSSECVRQTILRDGGLTTVLTLIREADHEDVEYIEMMLNLIWKACYCSENAEALESMGVHQELMNWVDHEDLRPRIPATGAVGELAKLPLLRTQFLKMGVTSALTRSLLSSNVQMVQNATNALESLAGDEEGAAILKEHDCVRLLWSLLTNRFTLVRRHALLALKPCLRNDTASGEVTRSITGAIHLIIRELHEKDSSTLAAVCAIIAEVSKDLENLAVMSEKGVVGLLSNLCVRENIRAHDIRSNISLLKTSTPPSGRALFKKGSQLSATRNGSMRLDRDMFKPSHNLNFAHIEQVNENLRCELAAAIAGCCALRSNRVEFGQRGVIPPLVDYLDSRSSETREQAAKALWRLSEDAVNCIQIHLSNAVPKLLLCFSSENQEQQVAAAGCMKNVRLALLKADYLRVRKPKSAKPKPLKRVTIGITPPPPTGIFIF